MQRPYIPGKYRLIHMPYREFKFRKPSLRKTAWDYGSVGFYFVTICVKDWVPYFGRVCEGQMVLNDWGRIARDYLMALPKHHHNVRLDEFVIMPNHVHVIVEITGHGAGVRRIDNARDVDVEKSQMSPLPGSLSAIIRSFKSACTKTINERRRGVDVGTLHATPPHHATALAPFRWQAKFYDEVVADQTGLDKIREYIRDNPIEWELKRDRNYGLYY